MVLQIDIVKEFFIQHQLRDISHSEVVDWVVREWKNRTGNTFRYPGMTIRSLYQRGFLIKVRKGVYRYDPDMVINRELENFTPSQKREILQRDGYKCVVCGKGIEDGVELHVDHIKPKDLGGRATIENGQTLCGQHNYMKKNLKQTETGKKMFIRLYELAKSEGNDTLKQFCAEILDVFERNNINGHIEWEK